jgi:hypothetical protein
VDSGACAVRGNFVAGAEDRAIEILFARNVSIESSRRITCFLGSLGTKITEEIVSFPLYCETWISLVGRADRKSRNARMRS